MADTTTLWRVPYTAPGILRGHIQVWADGVDSAIAAARAIHTGQTRLYRTGGRSHLHQLTKEQVRVIEYGTPTEARRQVGGAA